MFEAYGFVDIFMMIYSAPLLLTFASVGAWQVASPMRSIEFSVTQGTDRLRGLASAAS